MQQIRFTLTVVLAMVLAILCASISGTMAQMDDSVDTAFQTLVDNIVSEQAGVHSAVMLVEGPDFKWSGAAGLANPAAGAEMTTQHQYRSASVTKTITATLAVKLAEQGVIDLDAPLADYLPDDVIDGIHVFEGVDYSRVITLRQALQHTTGVADYLFDERDEGNFSERVLVTETERLWEPVELVDYVKENSQLTPHFAPGEGMEYADTNYVLVGLAIETATGQALHEVYREQIFEPLGMDHTYLEFREEPRPSLDQDSLSHVFWDDIDYTLFRSISVDWAGGGLVGTVEDYSTFLRAFADDEIFDNPASREAMLDGVPWPETGGGEYGLGVILINVDGIEIWGHSGVGGVFMYYWPEGDVTICGTINQEMAKNTLVLDVITSLKQVKQGS